MEEFQELGVWWGETDDTAELEPIEDILHKCHFEDWNGNKVDMIVWLKQTLTQYRNSVEQEYEKKLKRKNKELARYKKSNKTMQKTISKLRNSVIDECLSVLPEEVPRVLKMSGGREMGNSRVAYVHNTCLTQSKERINKLRV